MYCRCDIPHTAGFPSNDTPCLSTTDVPFLYRTLSPHAAKPSPCTADATLLALNNLLYWYNKYDIPYNANILLTPHILFSYCRCNPPLILCTVSSHCTTFSLFCRCDPSHSAHFLYSHCRCEIPDNVDFLLQPHTLSSYSRCSFSDTVYFLLTLY